MGEVSTIGLDIAKSVFQVHCVDAAGQVVIRRQLKRRYVLTFFEKLSPCLVGIEACASSHHWSRKQHSSGGKDRLGSISKQGDRYLRGLFMAGALAVIRYAKIHGTEHRPWLTALLARRPSKVAAIALANKMARMVWAMMARGERYKEPIALAA